ncbi:MAG: FAD-binding oxidoreductase [Desulfuromonadaceae bacterium]|nr:FAD-binding oxidoreductase [Desulfuromonadaceae bacterium]
MLKEDLLKIVGDQNVFNDEKTLQSYGSDESFAVTRLPSLVVRTNSSEEVQRLVKLANETRTPLVPVSSPGGPRRCGDTVPSQGGVVVDLSGMNRILFVSERDKVAMVEPGVTFDQLEAELRTKNLRALKPLLPRKSKSVLTSYLEREPIVAPREQWDTTDPLICVEVVFGTGDMFRTGSAAQAPGSVDDALKAGATLLSDLGPSQTNFSRVLQGAQGTLGIVTWASVACARLPALQNAFFVASDQPGPLIDFSYKLTGSRIGDELFILNGVSLASILAAGPEQIAKLSAQLPPWILFLNLSAPDYLPEEKMRSLEKETGDFARNLGLVLLPALAGVRANSLMKILDTPPEPQHKTKLKGASQDIFFVTTLDRSPSLIAQMRSELGGHRYPAADIGIYLQPRVQGCSCHCEFSFPYDPADAAEKESLRTLLPAASRRLADAGAFFSRPYGPWAEMVYRRDAETTAALRKIKTIFDPNKILNPGRLCY